jgi:Na+/phosphate symporter
MSGSGSSSTCLSTTIFILIVCGAFFAPDKETRENCKEAASFSIGTFIICGIIIGLIFFFCLRTAVNSLTPPSQQPPPQPQH